MYNIKIYPIIIGAILSYILLANCARTSPSPSPTRLLTADEQISSHEPGATQIVLATQTSLLENNHKTQPTQGETSSRTNTVVPQEEAHKADVISLRVSGETGAYNFSVEVLSPDLGCEQYADWWEVIDEQGNLIYRRILTHSHVAEQPFVRSGGPVGISVDTFILIRAHMNNSGYGGLAFRGTVRDGFSPMELSPEFATYLEETHPLPEACEF